MTKVRWEWFSLGIGFVLLAALFLPGSSWLLKEFDLWLFKGLNSSLGHASSLFFAFLNSKYGEFLAQGCLVGLLYLHRKDVRATLYSVAAVGVFIALVQIVLHQVVFGQLLDLKSYSPALFTQVSADISRAWPLAGNQIFSMGSFPPAFATMLGIATFWIFRECGKRFGYYALAVSTLFVLPKLFGGAYGLSDLLFGTLGLLFLVAPLFCYIPRYHDQEPQYQSV
jgi:hypothetical protein